MAAVPDSEDDGVRGRQPDMLVGPKPDRPGVKHVCNFKVFEVNYLNPLKRLHSLRAVLSLLLLLGAPLLNRGESHRYCCLRREALCCSKSQRCRQNIKTQSRKTSCIREPLENVRSSQCDGVLITDYLLEYLFHHCCNIFFSQTLLGNSIRTDSK